MALLKIISPEMKTITVEPLTFSGNVTSDGNPVSRVVGLFLGADKTLISSTASDSVTGDWSITISGTAFDKYDIECIGEPNEKSIVQSRVSGI